MRALLPYWVLVRGHISVEWNDYTIAGLFWSMAVGGIERIREWTGQFQIGAKISIASVSIKADNASVDHGDIIALAVFQIATNKAADVFDFIALGLGQSGVLRYALTGAGGGCKLIQQLAPQNLLVLPEGSLAAAAYSDEELSVFGYLHGIPPCRLMEREKACRKTCFQNGK